MKLLHLRCSTTALGATVVVALLALACARAEDQHGSNGQAEPALASAAPTIDELSTATFEGIFDHPITLVDGTWKGPPAAEGGASRPTVELVPGLRLTGDLDRDGHEEAIVLLAESSGGSGTRLYLAASAHVNGQVSNLGTVLIGDRVQVRSARLDGDRIILDLLQAGPADALCCPTQKARKSWKLEQVGLTPQATEVTGTFSLADLEGSTWKLVEIGRGEPAPPQPEIWLRFEGDKVVGNAGCNRYFGGITEGETADSIAFSAMGATRMACREETMRLESRYLGALAETSHFRFSGGRLVLSGGTENVSSRLVFTPLEPEPPMAAGRDDETINN
ncbi:MAG: META domain-containing protein [Acidobacteriota bacterium]